MKPSPSDAKYAAELPFLGSRFQVRRMAMKGSRRNTAARTRATPSSSSSTRSPTESSKSLMVIGWRKLRITVPNDTKCQKKGRLSVMGPIEYGYDERKALSAAPVAVIDFATGLSAT